MKRKRMKNEKMEEKTKKRKGIDLINQYKEMPEPQIIWNGIVEGSSGLITGVGKTGKTTFAENLAMSMAVGKSEFYGYKLDGVPKKILFINLEEKLWRVGRRNSKQLDGFNDEEKELFVSNYYVAPNDFTQYLLTEENWISLYEYIKLINPEVLFIDSLTHMCQGEIEKSAIANSFIQMYRKYISVFDKTVFVVHHNTKGNEKPMNQDNIAGSRVIIQEFDFALGFGNIPTAEGGTYSCMLYNKDAPKVNTEAIIYTFDDNYKVKRIGQSNVFDLYRDKKVDGRVNNKKKEEVYEFILNKHSQGSQTISTSEFLKHFVANSTYSKQTMYSKIDLVIKEGILKRSEKTKGLYNIIIDEASIEKKKQIDE